MTPPPSFGFVDFIIGVASVVGGAFIISYPLTILRRRKVIPSPVETVPVAWESRYIKRIEWEFRHPLKIAKSSIISAKPQSLWLSQEGFSLMIKFVSKHMADLVDELKDGKFNWNNENCQLYFKLMKTKFKLSERNLLVATFYAADQLMYNVFRDSIDTKAPKTVDELVSCSVIYDIYNQGPESGDIDRMRRYCSERKIKGFANKLLLASKYKSARESLRLRRFESDLTTKSERAKVSIDERIRYATKEEFFLCANDSELDVNAENYFIAGADHSRQSRLDENYRRHFAFVLIGKFENKCGKCQIGGIQLELDHFWMPKSSGGNFVMRSRAGLYTNNCIPLCRSCNASKGNRALLQFFSIDELKAVVPMSQSMNSYINTHLADFDDDAFEGTRAKAA